MQRKKHEIEILRLKIATQDLEEAEHAHRTGSAELQKVLQEIRSKIHPDYLKKYDQQFFPDLNQESKKSNSVPISPDCSQLVVSADSSISVENQEADSIDDKNKKPWVKKIYKKIVQRTHPDKYIDFPVKEIKDKFTKIYVQAVAAFDKNDIGALLVCAYEAEVNYDHVDSAIDYIVASYELIKSKIAKYSVYLGYQWFYLEEKDRLIVLRNYLRQEGYEFNEKVARAAMRKVGKPRKVGERPENILGVKRKKIK